ncbi:MAG: hypothetical protein ILP10_04550, partial [Lachnospiraceae bacterium]|nr:hypothetical protein [Lachnospiraceae bacterium]
NESAGPAEEEAAEESEEVPVLSSDTSDESILSDTIKNAKMSVYENDADKDIISDLSDLEVDGQEEFDYLDLNDPES